MNKVQFNFLLLVILFVAGCSGNGSTVPAATPDAISSATPTMTSTALPLPTAAPEEPISPTVTPVVPTPELGAEEPAPTETATGILVTGSKDCTDTAAFFADVTVPDGMAFQQNVEFVKTWRIRNEGTCTWGAGYALVFHSGDLMSGPLTSAMPEAKPGELLDISVPLKSPSSGGTFIGYWEFRDPYGVRFGVNSGGIDLIWVKIGVTIYNPNGVVVPIGATPAPTQAAPAGGGGVCGEQTNPDFEQQVLTLINGARAEAGLPALTLQSQLAAAALAHSTDMGCNNFVDHAGSDGSTWYTRIRAQGYNYSFATENIYVGDPAFGGTPQGAFDWWMNSRIHRDNILSSKVTQIGIGYVYVPGSSWGGYYTLNFAKP